MIHALSAIQTVGGRPWRSGGDRDGVDRRKTEKRRSAFDRVFVLIEPQQVRALVVFIVGDEPRGRAQSRGSRHNGRSNRDARNGAEGDGIGCRQGGETRDPIPQDCYITLVLPASSAS